MLLGCNCSRMGGGSAGPVSCCCMLLPICPLPGLCQRHLAGLRGVENHGYSDQDLCRRTCYQQCKLCACPGMPLEPNATLATNYINVHMSSNMSIARPPLLVVGNPSTGPICRVPTCHEAHNPGRFPQSAKLPSLLV